MKIVDVIYQLISLEAQFYVHYVEGYTEITVVQLIETIIEFKKDGTILIEGDEFEGDELDLMINVFGFDYIDSKI